MESTKIRNYLLAVIFITYIIGIFVYQNYEEKKEIKVILDKMTDFDNIQHYNKYIESGMSKDSLGDYKGAIEDYNTAIFGSGSDLEENFLAYFLRGISETNLKDYKRAIIDFDKAIQINSSNSNSYLYRGYCKLLSKDKNGACLDWSKGSELGNDLANEYIKEYCN